MYNIHHIRTLKYDLRKKPVFRPFLKPNLKSKLKRLKKEEYKIGFLRRSLRAVYGLDLCVHNK